VVSVIVPVHDPPGDRLHQVPVRDRGEVPLVELIEDDRPDPVEAGTATVVTFEVATRDYQRGDRGAGAPARAGPSLPWSG